jgi:putative phosphoesterase
MKVGMISDVHGDYGALEKTLNKLKIEHQVSRILCAGDLVGRGPEPNRVVDCLRRNEILTVRGNHDEYFYDVSEENVAYLKNLLIDWKGKIGGLRVFMCHGKPGNNMWGMYRDHLSQTYLKMVLKSLKVDVLVTGHTHLPLFMRVERGVLVNPGSLYTIESTRQSSKSYGVLDLDSLEFEVFDAASEDVVLAEVEYEY